MFVTQETLELILNVTAQSYRAIQQKFQESVESIDSNNIVKIINMQPYHIDVSSLTLSPAFMSLIQLFVGVNSTF